MDSKQIDTAMRCRLPVVCNGQQYRRIVEYISWYDATGNQRLSVVLEPMQGRYTMRVPAEKVEEVSHE